MDCPRCGSPMDGGICPECGFPVNRITMEEKKWRLQKKSFATSKKHISRKR